MRERKAEPAAILRRAVGVLNGFADGWKIAFKPRNQQIY
jgi:hypothetical protein